MAKTTAPDTTDAAQDEPLAGKSALEVLAAAGDEASRVALGQPSASSALSEKQRSAAKEAGFTLGEPAPRDVFVGLDGKESSGKPDDSEPFRGSQVAFEGSTVTASTLAALAAAGVV